LRSGAIIAVEALVRWNSKERGLVSPMEFIPVAEETRLIIPIGEQILRMACRQWSAWNEQGIVLRMAVNVSPVQFREPSFCSMVEGILREAGMPAQSLEIEITEGVLMGNTEAAMKKLQTIKEMGVTVAVDDFGTGYSSLEYLKDLPIDRLKIDASFVRLIGQDEKALAIVRTIEALAVNLNVETIAEGIETSEQLSALQDIGSSLGQGYFICRPQAAADIDSLLRRGSWI
jgi:EAL domain-containing protein (putative c-di-GMP-specific phosphodiesterase class I)